MQRALTLLAAVALLATSVDARRGLMQNVNVDEDYITVDLPGMGLQDKLGVGTPSSDDDTPLPRLKAPDQYGGDSVVPSIPETPAVPGMDNLDDKLPSVKVPSMKNKLKDVPVIGGGGDASAQSVTTQGTIKAQDMVNVDSDRLSLDVSNLPRKAPAMPEDAHTPGAGLDHFINSRANSSLPLTSPRSNYTLPELTDSDLPDVNVDLPSDIPAVGSVGTVVGHVFSQSVEAETAVPAAGEVSAQDIPFADYIEDYDGSLNIALPALVDKIPDTPKHNFSGTHLGWVHDPRANHTNETVVPDVPERPDMPNISIDSDFELSVPFPDMSVLDGVKNKINGQAVSETPVAEDGSVSTQSADAVCAQGARSYRVQAAEGSMSSVQAQGACEGVATEGEDGDGYNSARWTEEEMGCDTVSVMSTLKESVGSQSVYTGHQTAQGQCVMVRAAKEDLVFTEADCEESAAGVLCRQGAGPEVEAQGLYHPPLRSRRTAEEMHLGWPLFAAAALLVSGYAGVAYGRKRHRLAQMEPTSKYGRFQLLATAPVPLVGA